MSTRKRPPKAGLSNAVAHPAVKNRKIRSLLTRPLGLLGWEKLEPVLLAALTTREPLLLIGRHGTAKSFLLERLAQALGLVYRFYNASLINYDDLVGIPLPDETQTSLRYITTPTAIWDAEVVFVMRSTARDPIFRTSSSRSSTSKCTVYSTSARNGCTWGDR
jgi:AAA domain (dynein-related subfamily)